MQTINWYEHTEFVVMLATFILGVVSFLYLWKQNLHTKSIVESTETSTEYLESTRINVQRALELSGRQIAQANIQSEAIFRPNVFVTFENPELDKGRKIFIVVQNVGTATAFNVQLKFNPDLYSCSPHFNLRHLHALIDEIPSLPPGARIGHVFDHVLDIRKSDIIPPDEYIVTITYSDAEGRHMFASEQKLSMRPYTVKQSNWLFIEKIQ